MSILNLGSIPEGPLTLKINTLQRHYACFGSSGCGKTVLTKVLIEELANNGVPVIAIDPQGEPVAGQRQQDPEQRGMGQCRQVIQFSAHGDLRACP